MFSSSSSAAGGRERANDETDGDAFDDAIENLPSNDSFDEYIGTSGISSSLTETIKNGMRDKSIDDNGGEGRAQLWRMTNSENMR